MAHMTVWIIACAAFLPPLAFTAVMCGKGGATHRFAAFQLITSISIFLLVLLTFALDESSSIDLAMTLAFLSIPATFLFAIFVERWI